MTLMEYMMDNNIRGVLVSIGYVAIVLALSILIEKRSGNKEASRKFAHIALGGWWVIAMIFFSSPVWAASVPALFVLVNGYTYITGSLSALDREDENTPGTVYYAVSLTLITLLSFGPAHPYVGALGIGCMALGDGFAALAGKRFGKRNIPGLRGTKSVVGTSTMLLISFAVCAGILQYFAPENALPIALMLAVAATLLELISPEGLDNLTVPLGVTGLYYVLFLPASAFTSLIVGALISGVIAVAALNMRLLTTPAALGALVVGALFYTIGGWALWLLLMWFFLSSNVLSKVFRRIYGDPDDKRESNERKLKQVAANSLPALACAFAYAASGNTWFLIVGAVALAASTADTWASEVGIHSKQPPVNIITSEPIEKGLSGGVSPMGIIASAAGAIFTALLAMLLFQALIPGVYTGPFAFLLITFGGFLGSLVDSVFGILFQAKYQQGEGSKMLEMRPEGEADECTLVSGYRWITNDAVNLMTGIAVVAASLPLVL